MTIPFDRHTPGCKPTSPCRNCEFWKLLKEAVKENHDYDKLVALAHGNEYDSQLREKLELSIHDSGFGLLGATRKLLEGQGISRLRDLVPKEESELLRIPNLGKKKLIDIKDRLMAQGLHLGMDISRAA